MDTLGRSPWPPAGWRRGASIAVLWLALGTAALAEPLPTAPSAGAPPADGVPDTPAAVATAPPTWTTAEASARRALCDDYVAAIAGNTKDPALLEKDEVRVLAKQVPDLANCGAIASDSNAACNVFAPASSQMKDCLGVWSMFHEVRTSPKGRAFLFDEAMVQECRQAPALAPFCEAFRDALRSANANDCAQSGPFASVCRAYIALDPSLCRVTAPEVEGLDKDCRQQIANKGMFAKGLKAIAASGAGRYRSFARAAMGDRDACKAFATAVKDACVAAGQPPTPAAEAPRTPAATPAAPATGAPATRSGVG